ncbi:MAG: acylphosphatase [Sporolactobacillus sp.]
MARSEQLKDVHLLVEGRVQAVGFRYFTLQLAQSHHITGWVRNRDDGTVEIKAEGTEEQIKEFISAVKKGSTFSRVKSVDLYTYDYPEHFSSFEILNSL